MAANDNMQRFCFEAALTDKALKEISCHLTMNSSHDWSVKGFVVESTTLILLPRSVSQIIPLVTTLHVVTLSVTSSKQQKHDLYVRRLIGLSCVDKEKHSILP